MSKKLTKNRLQLERRVLPQSLLNRLYDIVNNVRVSNKRDNNRINLAKEHLRGIKRHLRSLNERINSLEEELNLLKEEK